MPIREEWTWRDCEPCGELFLHVCTLCIWMCAYAHITCFAKCTQLSTVMTQFSTVMKDRKKTSMFPLTLNHTQTQGRLPTAFCQSPGPPARLSLGHGRLHFYPSESPSACFLQHKRDLFFPSAVSGSCCSRQDRPIPGWFKKPIPPK